MIGNVLVSALTNPCFIYLLVVGPYFFITLFENIDDATYSTSNSGPGKLNLDDLRGINPLTF